MEDMVDSFRGFSNKGFNTMVKILEKHQWKSLKTFIFYKNWAKWFTQ